MSLIGRIFAIFIALLIAFLVAGITLAIGIVAPDWAGVDSDPFERVTFFVVSFFATSFVGAVAFVPAIVVIAIAESRECAVLSTMESGVPWSPWCPITGRIFHSAWKTRPMFRPSPTRCNWRPPPESSADLPIG